MFSNENCILQLSGVGEPLKKSSLKHLVGTLDPDIIFLQETLGDCISITQTLESLLVGWYFVAVDMRGRSSGVAIGWKNRSCRCENVWGFG